MSRPAHTHPPWEVESLLLEVGVEAFLNLVQQNVGLRQPAEHVRLTGGHKTLRVLDRLVHDVLPVAVHDAKLAAFLGHLCHDVLGAEDGLQVQPCGLALNERERLSSSENSLNGYIYT